MQEVVTGAEGSAGARQHDDVHGLVRVGALHRGRQLAR
jgi:hypothetical protein